MSWAWACITIAIAHAARSDFRLTQAEFQTRGVQKFADSGLAGAALSNAILQDMFEGAYVEPSSSAVCAIMFGAACGFLLWLRGYLGPGPVLFGIIFAIILQVITVTIAALAPWPYYTVGVSTTQSLSRTGG